MRLSIIIVNWNGKDKWGKPVSTGVYICQATYRNVKKQIKLLFIK